MIDREWSATPTYLWPLRTKTALGKRILLPINSFSKHSISDPIYLVIFLMSMTLLEGSNDVTGIWEQSICKTGLYIQQSIHPSSQISIVKMYSLVLEQLTQYVWEAFFQHIMLMAFTVIPYYITGITLMPIFLFISFSVSSLPFSF